MGLFDFKFGNKQRLAQLEQQNVLLEQLLQSEQQQKADLKNEYAQLKNALQQQIERLTSKLDESIDTSEIYQLRSSNRQYEMERDLLVEKEQRLHKEIDAMKQTNAQLQLAVRQVTAQQEQLQKEAEQWNKQRSELLLGNEESEQRNKQLAEQLEQQQQSEQQLQVRYEKLETTNEELRQHVVETNAALQSALAENERLQIEQANALQQLSDAQFMQNEQQAKLEAQQLQSKSAYEKQQRQYDEATLLLQQHIAQLQQEVATYEKIEANFSKELAAKKNELDQTTQQHLLENKQLVEQLQSKQTDIQQLEMQLQQSEQQEAKLKQQLHQFEIEQHVRKEVANEVASEAEGVQQTEIVQPISEKVSVIEEVQVAIEQTEVIATGDETALPLTDLVQVETAELDVALSAEEVKMDIEPFVVREVVEEEPLIEQVNAEEEDSAMTVAQAFEQKQPKVNKRKKYEPPTFLPRTEEYEHRAIASAVLDAQKEYGAMEPITSRYAIRDRDEMRVDFATAYVNDILSSRKEERREILRRFMDEPYFARMDVINNRGIGDTYYISNNSGGYGGAISWKSEVASLFYLKVVGTAVQHKTLGVTTVEHIQQFKVARGKIVQFYAPMTNEQGANYVDHQLIHALSERKGDSMDAIVSTIQKEQYEMISLPIDKPIIIQGSAGSGKSAIALHRLSYLLYRYPNLTEESVAMIGPNETFLSYIQLVLPALGDFNVTQLTFEHLAKAVVANTLSFHPDRSNEQRARKTAMPYSELIETYTRIEMNRIDRWFEPLVLQQEHVQILPVALKMDRSKHLTNSDRLNLYYNLYLEQWNQQVKQMNDRVQQQQQIIDGNVARLLQTVALPTVQKELFIDEAMTMILNGLLQEIALNSTTRSVTLTNLMKQLTQNATRYISSIIRAFTFEREMQSILLELLTVQWESHVEQQLAIYKDQFIARQLRTSPFITEMQSYLQQLEQQWIAERPGILTVIEATKATCLEEWRVKLQLQVQQQTIAKLEAHFVTHIQNGFATILALYNAQKKYPLPLRMEHTIQKLPLYEVQENDHQTIKQFIEKRIELNSWKMYRTLFANFDEVSKYVEKPAPTTAEKSDMAALLHIDRLLNGILRKHRFKYMIIDEAQDYLPYEMQEMRLRTSKNGIMLIGDLGQNLNDIATVSSWSIYDELLQEPKMFELAATYRSTKQIVAFSNELIAPYAKGRYKLSTVAYRDGEPVTFVEHNGTDEEQVLVKAIEHELYERKLDQVVCIVKNEADLAKYVNLLDPYFTCAIQTDTKKAENARVILTTVKNAKGLEFEAVVLVNFNDYKATDLDRKLAYVAASRALHYLVVIHEKGDCPLLK